MSEWEVQLLIEAVKIVIFLGQLILLFIVVDRLRTVSEGLAETRNALADLRKELQRRGRDLRKLLPGGPIIPDNED